VVFPFNDLQGVVRTPRPWTLLPAVCFSSSSPGVSYTFGSLIHTPAAPRKPATALSRLEAAYPLAG
jgi:hypothetical protein